MYAEYFLLLCLRVLPVLMDFFKNFTLPSADVFMIDAVQAAFTEPEVTLLIAGTIYCVSARLSTGETLKS